MQRVKLSVEEYLAEVLALVAPLPAVRRATDAASGATLAADVTSVGPVPAFANSAMDGFAVRHAELAVGVALREVAAVPAGSEADPRLGPGECARIMTGAPVPTDADTIVPRELVTETAAGILVAEVPPRGAHVRGAGEDLAPGQAVLPAGTVLEPRALSLVAACGQTHVSVVRAPVVAVVATGDEFGEPGRPLPRGKIFESNATFLTAAASRDGALVDRVALIGDDPDTLAAHLDAVAADADLIVCSGGVSVGDHDVVRLALAERGGVFRHVRMQPGKPQGWARWRAASGAEAPVLALPGNPLSAALSYELFVRPALERLLGRPPRPWEPAVAAEGWTSPAGRRQVVPVVVAVSEGGVRTVRPAHRRGSASHLVSALALADAVALVGEDVTTVAPGDLLPTRSLR